MEVEVETFHGTLLYHCYTLTAEALRRTNDNYKHSMIHTKEMFIQPRIGLMKSKRLRVDTRHQYKPIRKKREAHLCKYLMWMNSDGANTFICIFSMFLLFRTKGGNKLDNKHISAQYLENPPHRLWVSWMICRWACSCPSSSANREHKLKSCC